MKYAYYPGCSLRESAREFDVSVRAVMERLGAELQEIEDWTCCGASAVEPVSRLLTYALPARNLAIVEESGTGLDVLAPCSACYLNLLRVDREAVEDRALFARMNEVLHADGKRYSGGVRVRHLLDVLGADIGFSRIADAVTAPLEGMRVAPYYGCQILRPYAVFDDPRRPVSMEPVLEALGAEIHPWDSGGACCGASLMATHRDVAVKDAARILADAEGADGIATVCPMCQMNLEAYQREAVRAGGKRVPVFFLSQLMGLAFGMDEKFLGLKGNLSLTAADREMIGKRQWRSASPPESSGPSDESDHAGRSGHAAAEPAGAER